MRRKILFALSAVFLVVLLVGGIAPVQASTAPITDNIYADIAAPTQIGHVQTSAKIQPRTSAQQAIFAATITDIGASMVEVNKAVSLSDLKASLIGQDSATFRDGGIRGNIETATFMKGKSATVAKSDDSGLIYCLNNLSLTNGKNAPATGKLIIS